MFLSILLLQSWKRNDPVLHIEVAITSYIHRPHELQRHETNTELKTISYVHGQISSSLPHYPPTPSPNLLLEFAIIYWYISFIS